MSAKKSAEPKFLTIYQVADIMQLHFRTIVRCCEDGTIPAVKMQSRWRIPASAVEKLAASE